jgi:hypothetical protein
MKGIKNKNHIEYICKNCLKNFGNKKYHYEIHLKKKKSCKTKNNVCDDTIDENIIGNKIENGIKNNIMDKNNSVNTNTINIDNDGNIFEHENIKNNKCENNKSEYSNKTIF